MAIETQERKLTRRSAIIACLAAVGGRAMAQQATIPESALTLASPPNGIFIDLNVIEFLEVQRGKKTVRIAADEIWKALND